MTGAVPVNDGKIACCTKTREMLMIFATGMHTASRMESKCAVEPSHLKIRIRLLDHACRTVFFITHREFDNASGLQCPRNDTNRIVTDSCYCSCDDLSQVERPSVIAMAIAYLAQSLVVVIVGINMGLRLPTHLIPSILK